MRTARRIRVLVVDDNEDMRSTLQLVLERAGLQVAVAPNGAKAIGIQRRQPADVLITDLLMPEQDGLETIARFREDFPVVKIIAMSGAGELVRGPRYLATARIAGAHAVLQKPFEPEELVGAVESLVSGKGTGVTDFLADAKKKS